jgi:hypothetical protein
MGCSADSPGPVVGVSVSRVLAASAINFEMGGKRGDAQHVQYADRWLGHFG